MLISITVSRRNLVFGLRHNDMKKLLMVSLLFLFLFVTKMQGQEYQVIDLGTVGYVSSQANAINASGQIVGWATDSENHTHAFLYSNGVMQDLGTLGGVNSAAVGINTLGQIVGSAFMSSGANHAFLYTENSMKDLNNLIDTNSGWTLQEAFGINDSGQIVGYGINGLGQKHAFLLNPAKPIITLQPKSQTVAIGSTVYLTVRATNSPISYQWYFGTNAVVGATDLSLTLTNLHSNDSGNYTVVVSNNSGSVTSNPAMLMVLPSLGINMVPRILLNCETGMNCRIEYISPIGHTNAWVTLETIAITNNPQYYFDVSAIGQPARFYRLEQVP